MNNLYHYTNYCNLKKIIKPDAITWLARYYKYFTKNDYEWIRNEAQPYVQELCIKYNWSFDPDFQMFRPYIISFCKEKNSQYMWKHFGDDGKGINLIINEEVLRKEATLLSKVPALIVPCEYIKSKWTGSGLKKTIMRITENESLHNCQNDDRLLFATMGLLKNHYWRQKEIRYVTIEKKQAEVQYINGDVAVVPYEVPVDKYDIFINFPKELLKGVVLGRKTIKKDFDNTKKYLVSCGYNPDIIKKQK